MNENEMAKLEGRHQEFLVAFVDFKRSSGYQYGRTCIRYLGNLSRAIDLSAGEAGTFKEEMYSRYMEEYEGKAKKTIYGAACVARQYALYLVNTGHPNIYMPPQAQFKIANDFVPYIFTKEEIDAIFEALKRKLWGRKNEEISLFYSVLIRLLYGTGMRLGEALSLKDSDVDTEAGVITIRHAKGDTSRLVPMHDSLTEAIKACRERKTYKESELFFPSPFHGGTRAADTILRAFQNTILPAAGINPDRGGSKIRIHDLRHTFCCHTLNRIAENGSDTRAYMMYLSAYVGHKGIESTEWYLRLTEERMGAVRSASDEIYEDIKEEQEEWY